MNELIKNVQNLKGVLFPHVQLSKDQPLGR